MHFFEDITGFEVFRRANRTEFRSRKRRIFETTIYKSLWKKWEALPETERFNWSYKAVQLQIKLNEQLKTKTPRQIRRRQRLKNGLHMFFSDRVAEDFRANPDLSNKDRFRMLWKEWENLSTEERNKYEAIADEENRAAFAD